MDLTKERRIETGAFYTPRIWAAKAVEYIREIVPNMEDYIFMDVCCGEGSLLEALPKECAKFGTTLEWEDVEICRNKGLFVWQLDFLNESVSDLLRPDQMDRLIVFTNPPYYKLGVNHDCFAKRKYKSNDSVALFYYRILNEMNPILLCSFNKLDLIQANTHLRFRNDTRFHERILKIFLSPSKSWGLKGNFPIAFNIVIGN